jgi:hypothetical protein
MDEKVLTNLPHPQEAGYDEFTMHETPQQLINEGWQRMFVAGEPRLSEAVDNYQQLGYEVKLLPITAEKHTLECDACITDEAAVKLHIIFIRPMEHKDY